MSGRFNYGAGDEEPSIRLPWQEEVVDTPGTYADLDLSSGFTFALTLTKQGATTSSPSATLTGGVGYVDVVWAAGDLALAPGVWRLNLTATTGGRDRKYSPDSPPFIGIS